MTSMTGPDCAVMCNLINTHAHTHTHIRPGRIQDGSEDGSGDGNESNSGDGNGDVDGYGNEERIGEGRGEAKKRKKPHKTCRRHVGTGGDLRGKRKKRKKNGLVQ